MQWSEIATATAPANLISPLICGRPAGKPSQRRATEQGGLPAAEGRLTALLIDLRIFRRRRMREDVISTEADAKRAAVRYQ